MQGGWSYGFWTRPLCVTFPLFAIADLKEVWVVDAWNQLDERVC